MKIAIGITGLWRPDIQFNPVLSMRDLKRKFNADLYTHTWKGREQELPEEFREKGKFFPSEEPVMDYHPIFDPDPTTNPKHHWYRKTKTLGSKTINANKQILSYCNLFDNIPDEYDLYIKTRWDVKINPMFNFEKYIKLVMLHGPVGFMIRESGPNAFPFLDTEGKIVKKEKSKVNNNDWHDMLSDSLIMHKRQHLDTSMVYDLHERKQLLGAEWGWWQVLSKPFGGDFHTSVYGGTLLVR